jgi:hypothetical protein
MKTNHQRGFKETKKGNHSHTRYGGQLRTSEFADVTVGALWGDVGYDGHRGQAKSRAGGKKYIRSRIRFHENNETARQVQDIE